MKKENRPQKKGRKKIVKSALQICIYRKNVVSLQPNSKPNAMRVHERVEKK